jgi:formylglycine-generating enzyme required for sulfatase activity
MAVSARQQQPAAGGAILYGEGDNYPMYYVDWLEAVRYCNRRSVKEGLTPAYSISGGGVTCDGDANGYRLPTEAEWEYAAKGGSLDPAAYEYAGSNSVDTVAWYDGNSEKRTHEVGTKAPNSLGLYDMSGNVWEWCWDWYDDAPDRDYRVIRGGSWDDSAGAARSTLRYYNNPSFGNNEVGFRLARNE